MDSIVNGFVSEKELNEINADPEALNQNNIDLKNLKILKWYKENLRNQ